MLIKDELIINLKNKNIPCRGERIKIKDLMFEKTVSEIRIYNMNKGFNMIIRCTKITN